MTIVDNKKRFPIVFEQIWPATMNYIRSTRPRWEVKPEMKDKVRTILWNYAHEHGALPNIENAKTAYEYLLEAHKSNEVENFFRSKAKRKAAKAKRQKRRAERKARGERTGLGRFVHNIGKGVVNLQLLPLAPLKGMMRKILNKKGVATEKKEPLRRIVSKFFRFVIKPDAPKFYPEQAVLEFDQLKDDSENLAIGPIITTVISAVKGFLEHLNNKKKEGKALSNTEEEILIGADRAAKQVQEYKREETNQAIGGFLTKNGIAIIAGIILLAYVFNRK